MILELTVPYPESLPDALQQSRAEFERDARMAMAIKLYELGRLSSGQAAVLAGVDRVAFLLRLADFGVPIVQLGRDELEADVRNA